MKKYITKKLKVNESGNTEVKCKYQNEKVDLWEYSGLVTDGEVLGLYGGDIDGDPLLLFPIGSEQVFGERIPDGLYKVIKVG